MVRVLFTVNVPLTSFRIKCDLKFTSGGLEEVYLNPLSTTFTLFIEPIPFGVATTLPPLPPTVVIVKVGSLV